MAKRVRVSDNGSNWYTLPGNTAELSSEAGEIDDTIFGQEYGSTQSGIIGWSISANGLYKGFAGYVAKILKPGTSTSMTTEATTQITVNKVYQITAEAKRVINRNVAWTVQDGGTLDNDDVESIDYLNGIITLNDGVTVVTGVTITGEYLPMENVGCANSFTLTQTAVAVDNTCMDTAQANDGHRTFEYGLKTVSLDLSGTYKVANGFLDLLVNRTELVIEVNPDGDGKSFARGWFKPVNTGQSGDVGDLEQETITFNLYVPGNDDLIPYPFKWYHANDTTLGQAMIKSLTAWETSALIDVQYLHDGMNGVQGEGVITDLTLSGGLEVMNEFTVNIQGSDDLTAVP